MTGKFTNLFSRRQARVRHRLSRTAHGKPRLSVFRSSKHIYAQVIDDLKGQTLAAASSQEMPEIDAHETIMSNSSAALVGAAGMKAKKRGLSHEITAGASTSQ